ncbi:MAG TPA: DMT family transporter [Cyclobacteriaceae bacterium]|nr:DMT family transporter [Cytophagales bacterium]HNT51100.1 DMT family transporter [Cyclobacteriaceae bacterium]HRE65896.1 DMT family transporter [Cyclobacteriaceae bacterium]HRF33740.1 DMT family transporter [Cyclobacteriaceae bacterium]
MITTTRDYIHLHFLVFLWGFTAVLGKLISIPSVEMVFYRTLLAAAGIGVAMLLLKKTFSISSTLLTKVFATSIIVAIHWIAFFVSGKISNPSTSLVGFATCSFWAAILEPIIKRKKISAIEIALGVVVLIGLGIILAFDFKHPLGLLLGVISGLTAAWFSIINSKLVHQVNAYTITFYEMLGACLLILFFMPFYVKLPGVDQLNIIPTLSDWFYISIMAWACSVYAFTASINLSKRISVFMIQLALNLEPVYGIVLALLVFGQQEVMNWPFYLGTTIVLSAVIIYPILKNRTQTRAAQ